MRIILFVSVLILIDVRTMAQEESSNSFITHCRMELDPKTNECIFTEFGLSDLWNFTKEEITHYRDGDSYAYLVVQIERGEDYSRFMCLDKHHRKCDVTLIKGFKKDPPSIMVTYDTKVFIHLIVTEYYRDQVDKKMRIREINKEDNSNGNGVSGKQSFPQYSFSIRCPVVLKDVSIQSNDDFDFNYAGNTSDAFYQIIIIKLPPKYINNSSDIEELFIRQGGGKHTVFGSERLPAYQLNDYTHEGYRGRGLTVVRNDLMYTFNVMSSS